MKLQKIQDELKTMLSKKRFKHSEGVAASAKKLAERYGADPEKAEFAGWIHDCAKEMKLPEMQALVDQKGFNLDDEMRGSRALLHGPAGSAYAELHWDVNDPKILSAIYYHTTGNAHMTLMEKIVFLADYIEPSRDFPGVEEIRKLSMKNLNEAVLFAYNSTLLHLIESGEYVYELTLSGRNAVLKELSKEAGKA